MTQIINTNNWWWSWGGTSYTAWDWIDITSNVISVDSSISDWASKWATAVQPWDDISDLNNDAWYIDSSALSWYQTTANMVTSLTWADNDHYPTAKAVADAITGWGNGDVLWPNSSTDWDIVLFDWATGKQIKDSWKSLSDYQEKLTTQTAYTSQWGATKVPQITTNSLGQVTWITEVDITFPTQEQADWNEADNTKVDYIKNKPTIPTDTSDLTNNAWFITGITSSDVTNALWYTPYSSANPSWYTSNTGDVVWPASSTDWHLALFDWVTGKLIKDGWTVPTGVPSWWNNWDVLTNVSWTPTWVALPAETVVSGDSGTTYTIKVANSDPSSWTPATTITFVL